MTYANKYRLIHMALNINHDTYTKLQFDGGLDWLKKHICGGSEEVMFIIANNCPLFWAWWRNRWEIRDKQFIYEASLTKQELPLTGDSLTVARGLYAETHALDDIKEMPNREAKAQMTAELQKARTAAVQVRIDNLKKIIHGK